MTYTNSIKQERSDKMCVSFITFYQFIAYYYIKHFL